VTLQPVFAGSRCVPCRKRGTGAGTEERMVKTVTVTSGKGGVGKTNLSANLAMHLASLGYRTCIFDADLGLANINILLGIYPEKTLEDVIMDNVPLGDIIIKNYCGVDIIPGSSGVESIANLDAGNIEYLIKSFSLFDAYDYLFFDTSAGVSKNVVSFCLASSEIILVITPEPTSLTDAYALLKILCVNGLSCPVRVVVNHCKDTTVAKQTYGRFKEVAKKYLSIDIQPLGVIIEDTKISEAVKQQQPFVSLYPETIASKCIRAVANNFLQSKADTFEARPVAAFWKHFIAIVKGQLNLKGVKEEKKQEAHKAPAPEEGHASRAAGVLHKQDVPALAAESTAPAASSSVQYRELTCNTGPEPDASAPAMVDTSLGMSSPAAREAEALPATTSPAGDEQVPLVSAEGQGASMPGPSPDAPPEADIPVGTDAHTAENIAPALPEQQAPGGQDTTPPAPAAGLSAQDGDLYSLLNRLVNGITLISEEFSHLRKAVEGNGKLPYTFEGHGNADDQKQIVLDFETFVERRTRKNTT